MGAGDCWFVAELGVLPMNHNLTRDRLYRSIVGAVPLLVLSCLAVFAVPSFRRMRIRLLIPRGASAALAHR